MIHSKIFKLLLHIITVMDHWLAMKTSPKACWIQEFATTNYKQALKLQWYWLKLEYINAHM